MTEVSMDAILASLRGRTWQIEDVDQAGIIDASMITVTFTPEGRIAGSTGCNRYFGSLSEGSEATLFGGLGSTRRACAPALMEQEARVLAALGATTRIAIERDTWLVFYDGAGVQRLRAIELPAEAGDASEGPQDAASEQSMRFACEGLGELALRFLGPDTLELRVDGAMKVLSLSRAVSASGARYEGDGVEFWNKGDEALLILGERRHSCTRL